MITYYQPNLLSHIYFYCSLAAMPNFSFKSMASSSLSDWLLQFIANIPGKIFVLLIILHLIFLTWVMFCSDSLATYPNLVGAKGECRINSFERLLLQLYCVLCGWWVQLVCPCQLCVSSLCKFCHVLLFKLLYEGQLVSLDWSNNQEEGWAIRILQFDYCFNDD